MSLEDILETIQREGDAEVERIQLEARERARELDATAVAEAVEVEAREAHARDADAEAEADRIRNRALLQIDRCLNVAREDLYRGLRARVDQKLDTMRDDGRYPALYRALVTECIEQLPAASIMVIDARDRVLAEEVAGGVGGTIDAIEVGLDSRGGVELRTDDGRLVRNTFESRAERADPQLRKVAAEHIPQLAASRQ